MPAGSAPPVPQTASSAARRGPALSACQAMDWWAASASAAQLQMRDVRSGKRMFDALALLCLSGSVAWAAACFSCWRSPLLPPTHSDGTLPLLCSDGSAAVCRGCANDTFPDPATGVCSPCRVANCTLCQEEDATRCESGGVFCVNGTHFSNAIGTCLPCTATGCWSCAADTPDRCDSCARGFWREQVSEECRPCADSACEACDVSQGAACDRCYDGHYLDSSTNVCKPVSASWLGICLHTCMNAQWPVQHSRRCAVGQQALKAWIPPCPFCSVRSQMVPSTRPARQLALHRRTA